jgi:hypothetical protein
MPRGKYARTYPRKPATCPTICPGMAREPTVVSFPRTRESRFSWTPASAGVSIDGVLRGRAPLCLRRGAASSRPERGRPRGPPLRAHRRGTFTWPVFVGEGPALPRERPALPYPGTGHRTDRKRREGPVPRRRPQLHQPGHLRPHRPRRHISLKPLLRPKTDPPICTRFLTLPATMNR